jgi:tetratricopeptide (TPR) repeat protein
MQWSALPLAGLVVLAGMLAGCPRSHTTKDDHTPPAGARTVVAADVDRTALADAIDPGEQPPLSADVPRFLLDAIALPSPMPQDPAELVALAAAELDGWKSVGTSKDLGQSVAVVMGLARGVVLAERAVALGSRDTKTLSVLERLYDALDAPMISNDRAFFPQMMQLFVQASASAGHITDTAGVEAFSKVVFGTLERAGPAHRHTVAELLRTGDDPALVADALERVAPKLRKDDDALGVRAMKASLALRGGTPAPRHWVELADLCYSALDVPCGEAAMREAEAGAGALDEKAREDLDTSLQATRTRAKNAEVVLSLRDARGLGDRLSQARALLDLERHREAEAAYQRLRVDFPKEAGPVAGLARHAVVARFDLVGASRVIEAAGPVEHADREYYEIAIGCRATALIHDILPRAVAGKGFDDAYALLEPILLELREHVVAYEALGADEGVVLRFLLDVGMKEAVPLARGAGGLAEATPLLRGMLPRALAIRDRVPQSVHADLLMAGSVQFSSDPEAAFAALERPLPPDPKHAAAMRRAIAKYELIVTWEKGGYLPALAEDVAALRAVLDTPAVHMLEGDLHALGARVNGDPSGWPKAEAAYREALGDPTTATDARGLNNLAVAVAEQGRRAEAIELWSRAVSAGTEDLSLAKVNLAATREQAGDLAMLAAQETEGDLVEARLLAMAWRAELAPARERAALAKALRAKVAEEVRTQLRPRVLPGSAGIALRGSLSFGLGYSTVEGLQLDLTTASQPWLAMRPSALPLDPRASIKTRR